MVTQKQLGGIAAAVALVMSVAFLGSCRSFQESKVYPPDLTYDILGFVGAHYNSYEEAYAAAKRAYPASDAVVAVTAIVNASRTKPFEAIPQRKIYGYYAVKFKVFERKKILGIF